MTEFFSIRGKNSTEHASVLTGQRAVIHEFPEPIARTKSVVDEGNVFAQQQMDTPVVLANFGTRSSLNPRIIDTASKDEAFVQDVTEEPLVQALKAEGVSDRHIEIARKRQSITHESLTDIMRSSEYGFLHPEGVARVNAKLSGLPYFSPQEIDRVPAAQIRAMLVEKQIALKTFEGLLPVDLQHVDKASVPTLVLGLEEPREKNRAQMLFPGFALKFVIASQRTLQTIWRRNFANSAADAMALFEQLSSVALDDDQAQTLLRKFVLSLMRHACYMGASDIAFSPSASNSGGDVRLKVDGQGQLFTFLPTEIWRKVISHLKTHTGAQNTINDGPVDRRFVFLDNDPLEYEEIKHRYAFRVVLIQRSETSEHLVTVVMRILDQQADTSELASLGFDPSTLAYIRQVKELSTGLFLVTGPTGSGKTTTLYAVLNEIDPIERWVESIENPIEYQRGLWMQFQTRQSSSENDGKDISDEAKGAHKLLKGQLRAAPNVILFGEIRKGDIALELVDAGNTGHLVMSTLHNNDASLAIARLRSFGLDMSTVAALLKGILAQRLVRLLCKCAQPDDRPDTLAALNNLPFLYRGAKQPRPMRPVGCVDCHHSGYRGRHMVYELLMITPEVRELIEKDAPARLIAKAGIAQDGSLIANALRLVADGKTSLEEVQKLGSLKDV